MRDLEELIDRYEYAVEKSREAAVDAQFARMHLWEQLALSLSLKIVEEVKELLQNIYDKEEE